MVNCCATTLLHEASTVLPILAFVYGLLCGMQLALQNTEAGVLMDGQVVNNLRFADDIDLIAELETDQQELTDKVNCYSKKLGLRINEKKTQVMAVGKTDTKLNIWLDGDRLEQVKEFTYLGNLMTDDDKCINDIKKYVGLASAAMDNSTRSGKAKKLP